MPGPPSGLHCPAQQIRKKEVLPATSIRERAAVVLGRSMDHPQSLLAVNPGPTKAHGRLRHAVTESSAGYTVRKAQERRFCCTSGQDTRKILITSNAVTKGGS